MIRAIDPFHGEVLDFSDDALAVAAARAADAALPPSYADCFVRPAPPAADHPFMKDLAATGKPASRRARERLYSDHRGELERMAVDGSLPLHEQARLFGVKKHAFRKLRRWARGQAGLPPKPPTRPGSPPPRPALTPTEAARLNRIAGEAWPPPLRQEAFTRRLLAKQGPFVFGVVRQRKLSFKDGAALFRLEVHKFSDIKADFEVGLFGCWLVPPLPAEKLAVEAELLRREMSQRRPGQSAEDFCREVRLRFDLKMTQTQATWYVRNPETKPKGSPAPALTPEEQKRLAEIRGASWPRNWKVHDFRIDLFEQHGKFACALMDVGKLGRPETSRLFKTQRLLRLRAALAAGTLRTGPKPIASQADAARRRALLLGEYDLAPGDLTWPAFCDAFEDAHDLHLSPVQARVAVHAARPDAPRKAFPVPATVPPSDGERRRLKGIAQTPWDEADDPAALRRRLIRHDGAFLMGMMDEKKLYADEVSRLLRVRGVTVGQIRGAFRDGTVDHLVEPPLPPARRAPAFAVIEGAHRDRRPGEGDAALLRRTRRQHVLLVPDEALLKALRAARRRDGH
jgi:hypothetical protein